MSRAVLLLSVLSFLVLGCEPNRVPPEDGGFRDTPDAGSPGEDAPLEDAPLPTDDVPGLDAGTDAGTDGGMVVDPGATPPPTVTRSGTGGVLLQGTVLTPTGPLVGEVLVVGNTITCVAASCASAPMAGTVTVVDTHGAIISPGLLNAHDHLSYDFIPPWVPSPPELFDSRYEWRQDERYEDWISAENFPEDSMSDLATCPGSKWGELRNIVHGATTVQGQSQSGTTCLNRLARNADSYHGLYDGPDPDTLPDDFMRVTISGPCESGFPTRYTAPVPAMPPMAARPASGLIVDFRDGDARRFVVHLGEGVGGGGLATNPTREYSCYDGSAPGLSTADAVNLLRDSAGVPYETTVMIHGMPLTPAQLDDAVTANVRFVWSPSSNIILYGDTAPIAEMIDRGLTVALAPDWTVSGTGDIVSEMRYAYDYGVTMGITELTPRRLFEMTTVDASDVLGLEDYVGRLEVGMRADIVVFSRTAADPYRAVLDSHARDVTLTMIDGRAYYGALALEEIAVNGDCDSLDVCGNERFLCVQNTPPTQGTATVVRAADTLGSLEAELNSIIDMNEALPHVWPEATELLPLFDCSP